MSVIAQSTLHRIGQGCFYTCQVQCSQQSEPFRFVYDCGSSSKGDHLHKAIDRYVEELSESFIDFFVVSHYDEDHVNGLNYLFSKQVKIHTVCLPYLTRLQRLLMGIRSNSYPAWYQNFLLNPVSFLERHEVERIIFVYGGEGDEGSNDDPPPFVPDSSRDSPFRKDFHLKPKVPHTNPLEFSSGGGAQNIHVESMSDKGPVYCGPCWELKFFNHDSFSPELFSTLTTRTLIAADTSSDSKTKRWKEFVIALLDAVGGDELNPLEILRAISNKGVRKLVKAAYRVIRNDHNDDSLALWHGPVLSRRRYCLERIVARDDLRLATGDANQANCNIGGGGGGTMLTGDLGLNKKFIFDEFTEHYKDYLDAVAFIQAPHHGAHKSWNAQLLDITPDHSPLFLSAGIGNTYGHPGAQVAEDVLRKNRPYYQGNQHNEISMWVYSIEAGPVSSLE